MIVSRTYVIGIHDLTIYAQEGFRIVGVQAIQSAGAATVTTSFADVFTVGAGQGLTIAEDLFYCSPSSITVGGATVTITWRVVRQK